MATSIDEEARRRIEEDLRRNPDATAGELASGLLECACVGCPLVRDGKPCECVSGARRACRCSCRVEPYKSNNEKRLSWALKMARSVKNPTR